MNEKVADLLLPKGLTLAELGGEFAGLTKLAATLTEARQATDTNPSEAQAEAGNYRKGKYSWQGLTIVIENPKGSIRSGDGWEIEMQHDYGYFSRSEGKDGDQVDVFLGPDRHSELVFVVNQVDPGSGKFDEHKVVLGTTTEAQARKVYLANYERGWKGLGSIFPLTVPQLKWWLEYGNTKKAIEDGAFAKAAEDTVQAYKLFRTLPTRPGELFPLFIDKTNPVPREEWVEAENIPTEGFAPRPGWHAGALPSAPHLRSKRDRIQPGRVWAEVELPDDVDWQAVADASPTGDVRDQVPEGGHYRKKAPRMQGGEWLIGGGMKIRQVLSDDEVSEVLRRAGEDDAAEKERQAAETPDEELLKTAFEVLQKLAADDEHIPTVAVDLDGTIAVKEEPFDPKSIGPPRPGAKKWLTKFKSIGARVIVFTVRGDTGMVKKWLKENEIPYDFVNHNPDQPDDASDKVLADVYWDDRGVNAAGRLADSAPTVVEELEAAAA